MSNRKIIDKATVCIFGDPSVGIPHTSFDVELFIDPSAYANPEDFQQVVVNVRNALKTTYAAMTGEDEKQIYVFFNDVLEWMTNHKEEITKYLNTLPDRS